MAKKYEKKGNEKKEEEVVVNITKKLWAVFGILLFLLIFYLLALYITNKNSTTDETKEEASVSEVSISYDKILLGRSLEMSSGDYLVICYDYSDENINNTYTSLVSSYKAKDDSLPIYSVDMSSQFNKKYVGEEANTSPKKVDDMVISGPTLMKVSNNEVVEYIQGEESISDYLK